MFTKIKKINIYFQIGTIITSLKNKKKNINLQFNIYDNPLQVKVQLGFSLYKFNIDFFFLFGINDLSTSTFLLLSAAC